MQHMTTVEQLRCAGVVAAVTISRSAFPNRLDHGECLHRFKAMKAKGVSMTGDDAADVVALLTPALRAFEKDGKTGFVMGKTRVYFKGGVLEFLEQEKNKHWNKWVIEVQRVVRGWLVYKKNAMRRFMALEPKATQLQIWWRAHLAHRNIKRKKKAAKLAKKAGKRKIKMLIKIQAVARGYLIRPKFQEMLREKKEKDGLKDKIKDIEEKIQEAEKRRMKEVEEAREAAEKEIEEYKAMVKEEMKSDKEKQKKSAQQQTLIDESGKIIEYLRKENMKLRTQNDSLKKDYKSLKENNARLMEANASASQSFTALNDHAKNLNSTNAKLIKNVEGYKQQLEKLKEDLKARQAYYLAQAEARLAYQKTMAQIVTSIQDKCRDPQLVEDVVIMALECEASAKAERASLDAAGQMKKQAAAAAAASSSPVPTPGGGGGETKAGDSDDSDSDSDSDSD